MSYFRRVVLTRNNRDKLDIDQQQFLVQVVDLARYMQGQIIEKCHDEYGPKQTKFGVAISVLVAHMITMSDWGRHPVAADRYQYAAKNWEYGNNLALVKSNKYWMLNFITHDGQDYKSFRDWGDFAENFSDELTWRDEYENVLACDQVLPQFMAFSNKQERPLEYRDRVWKPLVQRYNLLEFDLGNS